MANPKSNSQISTLDDEPVEQSTVQATAVNISADTSLSGKKEVVTIHSSAEDGGSDGVFISHNGYAYNMPRDTPHTLPTEVAQILRDAVTTTYKSGAGGAVTERQMPRFSFTATPVLA